MTGFLERFDRLAGIGGGGFAAVWLERTAFAFLVVLAAAAPHSIAATQIAWGIATLATFARFAIGPRPRFRFRAIDAAIFGFFAWSAVSAAFSYEPATSFDRLKGVSLFLIFYVAIWNLRNLRAVFLIAFMVIVSCGVNLIKTPVERFIGRGVEIYGVDPDGPLAKASMIDGDAIVRSGKTNISAPDDLISLLNSNDKVEIVITRANYDFPVTVNRSDLLPGDSAPAKLGISSWTVSHSWRAQGFYNHPTTYSEMLQMVAALIFGLLAAAIRTRRRTLIDAPDPSAIGSLIARIFTSTWFLMLSLAGACFALLLTGTRASQLAFMVAAFVILVLSANRKFIITAVVVAIPIIFGGLLFLQQSRQVGLFDPSDGSTQYRKMMWRDGIRMLREDPRRLVVGVGMDSIQKHWQEFRLYDNGWQPMGHFHSVPVQLAVERGLPALLIWLTFIFLIAKTLLPAVFRAKERDWRNFGVLLGTVGALAGFCTSGLVHWNLGDAEVAMVFYLLTGIGIAAARLTAEPFDDVSRI